MLDHNYVFHLVNQSVGQGGQIGRVRSMWQHSKIQCQKIGCVFRLGPGRVLSSCCPALLTLRHCWKRHFCVLPISQYWSLFMVRPSFRQSTRRMLWTSQKIVASYLFGFNDGLSFLGRGLDACFKCTEIFFGYALQNPLPVPRDRVGEEGIRTGIVFGCTITSHAQSPAMFLAQVLSLFPSL